MTLFKLSLKNLKKSVRDYAIYFLTLVLGVAIFYVFNAIEDQTVMLEITATARELINLMLGVLSGVSVFVAFILGFLIIYASRFLMKRRGREFAIYMTLGMGKGQISRLLLTETLMIGIVSLVVGLVLGVGLSQIMSALVVNMFQGDMTEYGFVFSPGACVRSCIYFGIMYLIVMMFQTFSVGKCQLIDLLRIRQKAEKVRMKNPSLSVIVFLAAVGMLAYAYYVVTRDPTEITADMIRLPMMLGCAGTFLVFWSVSGFLLQLFMAVKRVYFRGLNCFVLRQISSKINTTVWSMTVICLMLFVAVCAMSACLSINNSMNRNLDNLAPVSIQLKAAVNLDESDLAAGYTQEQIDNSNLTIPQRLEMMDVDIMDDLKDVLTVYTYESPDVTMGASIGEEGMAVLAQNYRYMSPETHEDLMKISDYNRVAQMYGKPTYTLAEDEYMVIANMEVVMEIRNEGLASGRTITVSGRTLHPKYAQCQDGILEMAVNPVNNGIILVPDDLLTQDMATEEYLMANYKATSREAQIAVEDKLTNVSAEGMANAAKIPEPDGSTRISLAEGSMGFGAMITFIGLYLGIIFLISGAAILALKEMSDSEDNRERFQMLRELGAEESQIGRALFAQIGIFFLCPLVLAVIHSIFGLKFCELLLVTMGDPRLLESVTQAGGIIVAVYGGYFLLTYLCSRRMIRERR